MFVVIKLYNDLVANLSNWWLSTNCRTIAIKIQFQFYLNINSGSVLRKAKQFVCITALDFIFLVGFAFEVFVGIQIRISWNWT